ncbi:DsbA family protein [Hyphomicrobium sp.]|uniref:DsbA family protein n=1 Tax=Hyphomicrobium sp. TaxID=82 RepID=UPI0025B9AA69|nr:DsbA family protein [Hyphomicrobium sp.]MCC7252070.1 DsbA family protein [Hyphomicrobium sp.]
MTQSDLDKPTTPSRLSIGALVAAPLLLIAGLWLVLGGEDKNGASPATGLIGANSSSASFSPDQRRAIEGIVKDYLVQNPEIFLEVQSALEAKVAREEAERTKALVASYAKEIYRAPNAPVAGNPDGDITVVEFFDYNCGYCKRGFAEIAKLVEQDKNVRVVFKEFPILRDESEQAAHVALAARMQGKYWEVHSDLITTKGLVNEAVGLKIAEKHGLDMEKLKADMASPEVKAEIDRVKELAQKLSINGTPHFLVGDRAIGGAPENLYEVLEAHVTDLRKTGCNYC